MLKAHTWCKNFFTPRASTARGAAMTLEEVRQYIRDLDAKDCPVAKRARELREAKLEQARKERKAREQQRQAANISQSWWNAIDQRIHEYILQNFSKGGWLTEVIGQALGAIKGQLRKEFRTAIDTLRGEVGNADDKLRNELRSELDRRTWSIRSGENSNVL